MHTFKFKGKYQNLNETSCDLKEFQISFNEPTIVSVWEMFEKEFRKFLGFKVIQLFIKIPEYIESYVLLPFSSDLEKYSSKLKEENLFEFGKEIVITLSVLIICEVEKKEEDEKIVEVDISIEFKSKFSKKWKENNLNLFPSEECIKKRFLVRVFEYFQRKKSEKKTISFKKKRKKNFFEVRSSLSEEEDDIWDIFEENEEIPVEILKDLLLFTNSCEHICLTIRKSNGDIVEKLKRKTTKIGKVEYVERNLVDLEKNISRNEKENWKILASSIMYRHVLTLVYFTRDDSGCDLPWIDRNNLMNWINNNNFEKKVTSALKKIFLDYTISDFEGKRNRGLLMYGPPGSGKTFIASKLCKHLGIVLTNIDHNYSSARFMSAFHGQTGRNIIKELKSIVLRDWLLHGCILDEAESTLTDRNVRNLHQTKIDSLNSFLPILSNSNHRFNNVVFIAATNNIKQLDKAAIRNERFDVKVFVGALSIETKAEVICEILEVEYLRRDNSILQNFLSQCTINFTFSHICRISYDVKNYFLRENSKKLNCIKNENDRVLIICNQLVYSIRSLLDYSISPNIKINSLILNNPYHIQDIVNWKILFKSNLQMLKYSGVIQPSGLFLVNVGKKDDVVVEQKIFTSNDQNSVFYELKNSGVNISNKRISGFVLLPLLEEFKFQEVYLLDIESYKNVEEEISRDLSKIKTETENYDMSLIVIDLDSLIGFHPVGWTKSQSLLEGKQSSKGNSFAQTFSSGKNENSSYGGSVSVGYSESSTLGKSKTKNFSTTQSWNSTFGLNENVQKSNGWNSSSSINSNYGINQNVQNSTNQSNSSSNQNSTNVGSSTSDSKQKNNKNKTSLETLTTTDSSNVTTGTSTSNTTGSSQSFSNGESFSVGVSNTIGNSGNLGNSVGISKGYSIGRSKTQGRSEGVSFQKQIGENKSEGKSYNICRGTSSQKGEQCSITFSSSDTESRTRGETFNYQVTFPKAFHFILNFVRDYVEMDIRNCFSSFTNEKKSKPFVLIFTHHPILSILVKHELGWYIGKKTMTCVLNSKMNQKFERLGNVKELTLINNDSKFLLLLNSLFEKEYEVIFNLEVFRIDNCIRNSFPLKMSHIFQILSLPNLKTFILFNAHSSFFDKKIEEIRRKLEDSAIKIFTLSIYMKKKGSRVVQVLKDICKKKNNEGCFWRVIFLEKNFPLTKISSSKNKNPKFEIIWSDASKFFLEKRNLQKKILNIEHNSFLLEIIGQKKRLSVELQKVGKENFGLVTMTKLGSVFKVCENGFLVVGNLLQGKFKFFFISKPIDNISKNVKLSLEPEKSAVFARLVVINFK